MENQRKTRDGSSNAYDFRFECQEGKFKISATGFKMYVRRPPILLSDQCLEFKQRGGISFGREIIANT